MGADHTPTLSGRSAPTVFVERVKHVRNSDALPHRANAGSPTGARRATAAGGASRDRPGVKEDMPPNCPMSWVTKCWGGGEDYNTRKSAFWRVIRATVGRLRIADINADGSAWPSQLVWSNLYKIAPAAGGNPNNQLQRAQFEGCLQLLHWEIETFKPKRLLFLTGLAWAGPFLEHAWCDNLPVEGQVFIEAKGYVMAGPEPASCVIASHPQGKNERNWVDEVVAAFSQLSS